MRAIIVAMLLTVGCSKPTHDPGSRHSPVWIDIRASEQAEERYAKRRSELQKLREARDKADMRVKELEFDLYGLNKFER